MRDIFGRLPDGRAVEAVTLVNATGIAVRILAWGGIVQSVRIPDTNGAFADVALGYPDLAPYLDDPACHGAIVGRYANRIAHGRFTLDGIAHTLSRNDGDNTLHGGAHGFNRVLWQIEALTDRSVTLAYLSPDGDQGFPGALATRATYGLGDDDILRVTFEASTDQPTVVNLASHIYWNLAGQGTIEDHTLQVDADRFTPVDASFIPTGELCDVAGTPFDFRESAKLGEGLRANTNPQIARAGGIDHNFELRRSTGLAHAATLVEERSGRAVAIWTTEPGLQVYTGNGLKPPHAKWAGIALETQHFPDSPNRPSFPSTALRPGEVFHSTTEFRLSRSWPKQDP